MTSSDGLDLRIGELAARAGVHRTTIRYYEREGLLPRPARTPAGYRAYAPEDVRQLEFIRRAKALGLRLTDVREVMTIADSGRVPCSHLRDRLAGRLAEVEERLRHLRSLRTTLRRALRRCDRGTPARAGCRCAVIEETPLAR